MSEQKKTILVVGATGKQGRSVLDSLLTINSASPSCPPFHVIAMVRDPSSATAQSLAKLPDVDVVQGDLSDPARAFERYGRPVWGVYSVQINSDAELAQGKAMVDAAIRHGVTHFVYSSGDRGGPERSAWDRTNVKNFQAKFEIEKYLETACKNSNSSSSSSSSSNGGAEMTFTVLRPVTFFENQSRDMPGKAFARMWMQMRDGERRLQMISTRDIGWFAAQAFAHADAPRYRNAALSIAGDELSGREAERVFREVTGGTRDFPMTPCLVGSLLKTMMRDTLGDMFAWFEAEGYGADVEACRREKPDMLDYRTWLKEYSGFV